jgi:hypothetical protein
MISTACTWIYHWSTLIWVIWCALRLVISISGIL